MGLFGPNCEREITILFQSKTLLSDFFRSHEIFVQLVHQ